MLAMSGELPSTLGGLSALSWLNLRSNNLSGAAPLAVCAMTMASQVECDLSANVPGFVCPPPAGCKKCKPACA